mmetsp:Transcript_98747/g.226908  ORF Transcript_98747/g.226908 Transcript_98747/m.226908 type:complete len:366 (-) Transcript_98747:1287-2384(-)
MVTIVPWMNPASDSLSGCPQITSPPNKYTGGPGITGIKNITTPITNTAATSNPMLKDLICSRIHASRMLAAFPVPIKSTKIPTDTQIAQTKVCVRGQAATASNCSSMNMVKPDHLGFLALGTPRNRRTLWFNQDRARRNGTNGPNISMAVALVQGETMAARNCSNSLDWLASASISRTIHRRDWRIEMVNSKKKTPQKVFTTAAALELAPATVAAIQTTIATAVNTKEIVLNSSTTFTRIPILIFPSTRLFRDTLREPRDTTDPRAAPWDTTEPRFAPIPPWDIREARCSAAVAGSTTVTTYFPELPDSALISVPWILACIYAVPPRTSKNTAAIPGDPHSTYSTANRSHLLSISRPFRSDHPRL